MIEGKKENRVEQPEEQVNIQEILFRYLIHWPWFVVSVIICIACAWGYLRLATPVYNISATVLIKDDKKGGGASMSSELEKIGLDGFVSSSNNVDNEIEVLKSKSLAREVVNNLGLFVTYKDEDEFPSRELYRTSPVVASLTPQEAEKLSAPMEVEMTLFPHGGMDALITVKDKEYRKHFEKLPAVFPTDEGTVAFFESKDTLAVNQVKEGSKERHIKAFINRPFSVAKGYANSLSIAPTSKTTSVVVVSLKNTNIRRGRDYINKLLEMYNINANNDKNEVAQKTAEFIDERIGIISMELGSTEQDLENFKRSAGITDLSSEAQIALTGNAEYEKKRVENQTQINLVMDLQRYMKGNEYEVLPSNIGLQDAASAGAIDRYNQMLVERERLLRTSTENNPAIINLDTSIRAMRTNVQATLDATLKGLQITKEDLAREAGRYSRRINDAPTQERQFVSIARQQEIKAGLYLMLLQKREENAITLAATANNAKIIDEALADDSPVSPKRMMIYLVSLVLGVGIPVGIIYLIGLTKFKIEGRADVEKLTLLPVVGDIPLADEKAGSIAVFENKNNLMSETFRNVRTNLQFMLEQGKNVILVTSTISGEGKSFVSANLAISLSLLGKKVVIVGLDIRKPGLNKVFNIPKKEHGITQFLTNPTINLMDLVQSSDINKNLFILPGGTVPPNPTELLARDGLEKAVETLKQNFDYVILDTAPVGLVTDTLLIGRVADLSVYVCRADYTRKAEFTLINEL
ncbi:GumC family protein, partial [Bacteroides acidifaciens]